MAADLTVFNTLLKRHFLGWIEYDFFHREGESLPAFTARRRAERRQRRLAQWAKTGVVRQENEG